MTSPVYGIKSHCPHQKATLPGAHTTRLLKKECGSVQKTRGGKGVTLTNSGFLEELERTLLVLRNPHTLPFAGG